MLSSSVFSCMEEGVLFRGTRKCSGFNCGGKSARDVRRQKQQESPKDLLIILSWEMRANMVMLRSGFPGCIFTCKYHIKESPV